MRPHAHEAVIALSVAATVLLKKLLNCIHLFTPMLLIEKPHTTPSTLPSQQKNTLAQEHGKV